jgi:hypothetical protein
MKPFVLLFALLLAAFAAPAQDGKTGLLGKYFKGMELAGAPALQRVDAQVNFDWGDGSPAEGFPADQFSVRWSGQLQAPATGKFKLILETDDGVRVWFAGKLVIDDWADRAPAESAAEVALEDGKRYDIIIEYFENGGGASAKLLWSGPSTLKQPIPSFRLTPKDLAPPAELDVTKLPADARGLVGHYFKGREFAGKPALRLDKEIAFDWGEGAPGVRGVGADDFCVRWTGQVKAEKSGTYTFIAEADDGVRLWVNGQKLVDAWIDQGATEYKGDLKLEAGKNYDVVMEYFENSGFAVAKLSWSVDGGEKQIIPSSVLLPKVITDKGQKR